MNLVAMALRIATVEALKGRTLAGGDVLDSQIAAVDSAPDGGVKLGQQNRFVAVYTYEKKMEGAENVTRPFHDPSMIDLAFEFGITEAMQSINKETGERDLVEGIPVTDATMEAYLDLLSRQIMDTLNDGAHEWADIWRALTIRVAKVESHRTDDERYGRLAARQIVMSCEVIGDPVTGEALDPAGAFERFLVSLEAHADTSKQALAALIRETIGGTPGEDWQVTRARLGAALDEMEAIGLRPLDTGDGETATASSATIETEGLPDTEVVPE